MYHMTISMYIWWRRQCTTHMEIEFVFVLTEAGWWKQLPIKSGFSCRLRVNQDIREHIFLNAFARKTNMLSYFCEPPVLEQIYFQMHSHEFLAPKKKTYWHECLITDFQLLNMLGISHWLSDRASPFAFQHFRQLQKAWHFYPRSVLLSVTLGVTEICLWAQK